MSIIDSTPVAVSAALLVVLAALAGAMTVATQTGSTVSVETSPTDPNDADATHAVVFTPSTESQLVGTTFDDIRINYSVDTPAADASNVGQGTIERIGIDRGGDDVGTRIDVAATVTEVSAASDGKDLQIKTNQELNIQAGDEIVVVLKPVQNPQNAGTANVDVLVNTESSGDAATDSVTYEYNDAAVNFTDQSTTGSSVTVDHVNLSEEGYVVILNESGRNPSTVRGATFLGAGNHSNVQVDIAPPVESQTELHAQVHLDSNGDHRFNYSSSGGEVDEPFANRDGNVMATDAATVWHADRTQTPTPTESGSDSTDDDPDITNYDVSTSGDDVTVSFDSDENLVDIEVDVRGPESATLTEEDFDGNRFEGYEATYEAASDGEYTLELTTAEDSSGNDGADDGDYRDSATVENSSGDDTATATPTDDGAAGQETASDEETESPTDDADTATDDDSTADEAESTTADATAEGTEDDPMDDETESPTDDNGAGFGGLVALSALLASALLFYRRR